MSTRPFVGLADHEPNARYKGIGLMITAFALFALLDACAKYMSAWHGIAQIVFARYAGHFLLGVVLYAPFAGRGIWRSNNLRLQILRSSLLLASTTLNFTALQYLQLAETASISFTIPLWVAVLSVPLLGEYIGPHRWAAVVVGFVGVLIIIRPGLGLMHWAVLLSLSMAVTTALYQILTRKLAQVDRAGTTQIYTALVGTLGVLPFALFDWTEPNSHTLFPMIAIGALGAVGHYFLIQAHRYAPAPILAPFSYTQIISMVAIGYWLFHDLPDIWTVVGGSVVIASGLYLLHRERIHMGSPGPN